MFCSKCGENLVEGTVSCPKCGMSVGGNNNVKNNPQPIQQIAIGGWVALVLGIIGAVYSYIWTMNQSIDLTNMYDIELIPKGLIVLFLISIFVFIIGIILLIKQKLNMAMQKKQKIEDTGDKLSIGFTILSLFVPLVGLILWLVWKKDTPIKAKYCGIGALIGFIIISAIQMLFIKL
jgi:uncharacterized BrkB/YihY/UPF0761 family membrane protein